VIGADDSSYTYAEAVEDQQMANWLKVQMNALEYYRGAAQLLIPDNTKTAVPRACIYEPDLNPTYQEFAGRYPLHARDGGDLSPRQTSGFASALARTQSGHLSPRASPEESSGASGVAALAHDRLGNGNTWVQSATYDYAGRS